MKKLLIILLPLCFAACTLIDDDLSVCGEDMVINYQMQLRTELRTQLQTELAETGDSLVREALEEWLSPVFTDKAKDIDLHFFSAEQDVIRRRIQDVINANQTSYTIKLPQEKYMHLALANIADNHQISLSRKEHSTTLELGLPDKTLLQSMNTGVFTARLPMEILEGVDQTFDVRLYMANSATTLVVDTIGSGLKDMKVFTTGFATGFNIADSTYIFGAKSPIIRTSPVTTHEAGRMTYCSVNFPSPEAPITRTIIETEEPFISVEAADALWELHIYVTTASGSVTENILYVKSPLRAGQLKVIKAKAFTNGSLESEDKSVAVSVRLDWSEGGGHDIEL